NSTLLVDHFHVTRLINDQLNHTRKRIMRKYAKNKKSREYRLLKHRYKILLKSKNNIDEEILNSFTWINDRRISNGPCEGKNNYVKKILSNANGMSNFQRARNSILYSQNKYETYTMNEHADRIKRIGNPKGAYKK
ncbi:transposase, partial [Faecalibacillus faecis]|uniref:transposase n=2 Tax=Faecalibacillus TaxID=2678885 RepID=UPI0022E092FF